MEEIVCDRFAEYGTDTLNVSDFDITVNGNHIDSLKRTKTDHIRIYTGTGKSAKLLKLTEAEREYVFSEVMESL